MHLSPRDPGFPHSAILHAIVEWAYLRINLRLIDFMF